MIRKIQNDEYLKRVGNMTLAEKEAYLMKVREWLTKQARMLLAKAAEPMAAFQNVQQLSMTWNDDVCRAWEDGVRLLTALVGKEDTWLPDMLYTKAGKRAIKRVGECLAKSPACAGPLTVKNENPAGTAADTVTKEESAEGTAMATQAVAIQPLPSGDKANQVPPRPKHIDQYVHLLPKKTQEHAAMVRGLLRDLDVARENARKLMDSGEHADKIAQWAKTATKLDEKVNAVYKELDAEWEKLVQEGKVVVDALGNASLAPDTSPSSEGSNQASDISHQTSKDDKKAKRLEYLKKWLRDTRTKNTPERQKLWKKNMKELLKLGGDITDSIRKAAEHYGVNIDEIKV